MLTVIIKQSNGSSTTFPAMRVDFINEEERKLVINLGNGKEAVLVPKDEPKEVLILNEHGVVVQTYEF